MHSLKNAFLGVSLFIVFIVGSACGAYGQNKAIHHFTLENGLEVALIEDFRSPVVVHMAWYKAGAVDEPYGKTGIAHMLEHMMFKGTKKLTPGEFSKKIAALGGQENAFTSYDYTAYYQKIARDNLSQAVALEADRAGSLNISDETFQPERDVILEERNARVDNNPIPRFFEKVSKHHLPVHPYGNPVIGWRKDIKNYTLEDAQNWYAQFYAPENMVVVFAGALGRDEAQWLANHYYGELKNPKVKLKRPKIVPTPLFEEPKRLLHTDPQTQLPLWTRTYRAPSLHEGIAGGPKPTHAEAAAISLLAQLLGGGTTSFLHKELVVKERLADYVHVSYRPAQRFESTFDITVQPKEGVLVDDVEAAIDALLTEFLQTPVDAEAVKRIKVQAKSTDVFARDDLFEAAYRLGGWRIVGGSYAGYENWLNTLNAVTPNAVMGAAARILNKKQSTTAILLPDIF